MIRVFLLVLLLVFTASQSNADCVTINQTTQGPPYAEFDLTNNCRGSARVHWIRRGESGQTDQGTFTADGGCNKTTHHQYFPGKYSFTSIEFPNGGESESCLNSGDATKRDDLPKQAPNIDLAKRLAAQQKANATASYKTGELTQAFLKRYETLKTQEQNRREQAETEPKTADDDQATREGANKEASCKGRLTRNLNHCERMRAMHQSSPWDSNADERFQLCKQRDVASYSACVAEARGDYKERDAHLKIFERAADLALEADKRGDDNGARYLNNKANSRGQSGGSGPGCYSPVSECINACLAAGALNCWKQCRENGGCFN